MNRDELLKGMKTAYDSKPINEIEKEAKGFKAESFELQERLTKIMFYLERTGRFRENPTYKKSTFQQYILDVFNVREKTYRIQLMSLISFPGRAPGLVAKIRTMCGTEKIQSVFNEIDAEELKLKTPIKRERVETIIRKYRKPVAPKPARIDWQGKYITLKKDYDDLVKVDMKKDEQIAKLKARVKELEAKEEQAEKITSSLVEMGAMINKLQATGIL